MRTLLITVVTIFISSTPAFGQDSAGDCLWCRDNLTGDVLGLRSSLADNLVVADVDVTQFYQGVASGGANRRDAYGGKVDYFFTIAKGLIALHAETRFGDDVNLDAVGLASVNANMLYPSLENTTAITGLTVNLPLSSDQEWILSVGKNNTLDLFNLIYAQSGRGVDGFMNASAFLPLNVVRTVPLAFLGAGILKMQEGQVQGALLVYDSNNIPTTSGFENLFDNGANILGAWRFFTEFGGRPGSHAFLGTYASGDFTVLDATGWSFVPGVGVVPTQESDIWSFTYIIEQQLWSDPSNAARNVGLLSSAGIAEPTTSPYEWTFNFGIQSRGLLPNREADNIGVAYFFSDVKDGLGTLLAPLVDIADVHGAELYYNAEITPWFHVTGDLQIIEPALEANDTAIVLGLRAKIDL